MKKMTPAKTKEEESRLPSGGMVAVLLVSVLLLIAAYPASADTRAHFDPSVRVMTRNLYVGADIFAVVNLPSPDLIPLAVAQTYAMIVQNDFAQRAEALAREIAEKNPDLIGCQEVVLLTRLRPADDPQAPPMPIEQYDFLVLLLDALQTCGLDYEVAAVGLNADVTLPMLQAIDEGGNVHLDYVNYRDRDVILAKKGVTVKHAATHAFRTNFTVVFSETQSVVFQRGFVAVDATVRGKTYRFVNAHVENEGLMASDGTVAQQAQVAELLQELAKENLPVLLVGDFNLIPEDPDHKAIVRAGFADLWTLRTNGRHKNGSTCCQDEDLLNEESALTERIDFIFARQQHHGRAPHFHYPLIVQLTGDDPDEAKTESGLWPSDHAGVFAAIRLRDGNH